MLPKHEFGNFSLPQAQIGIVATTSFISHNDAAAFEINLVTLKTSKGLVTLIDET